MKPATPPKKTPLVARTICLMSSTIVCICLEQENGVNTLIIVLVHAGLCATHHSEV